MATAMFNCQKEHCTKIPLNRQLFEGGNPDPSFIRKCHSSSAVYFFGIHSATCNGSEGESKWDFQTLAADSHRLTRSNNAFLH